MEYAEESLNNHNHYRSLHGVPPLKLNKDLVTKSADYAAVLLKKNKLEHSKNNPYGENLYYFMSTDPAAVHNASDAVKSWYDEHKFYNFKKEKNDTQKTGHFTQLIWKGTTEMGAAYANKDGKFYVVANYNPPGNVVGEYMNNVPPIIQVGEGSEMMCTCRKKYADQQVAIQKSKGTTTTSNSDMDRTYNSKIDKKREKDKDLKKKLLRLLKHFCCFMK